MVPHVAQILWLIGPRIFRVHDLIAHGAEEHAPVHLLLVSADELGFAWDGKEKC